MTSQPVLDAARGLAAEWREQRDERLARDALVPADFEALAECGILRLPVPVEQGGSWESTAASTEVLARTWRILAAGDASPALVSAMHPAVLAFWLTNVRTDAAAWDAQRRAVCATAATGSQWGTITSEPGSGGDVARTRSTATPARDDVVDVDVPGRRYLITGDKHFGSGTGVCSFMLTTAVPDGEAGPAAFFLDTRRAGEGATPGFTVVAPWDGVGMRATQSHGVRLEGCPAIRLEWDLPFDELLRHAAPVNVCLFTAVVLGVVDEAIATASRSLAPRLDALRPYEQVEWDRATVEHWLATQAFEGMLRSVATGDAVVALRDCLRGKVAVAELAEQVMLRLTRVIGGGTFSRRSPFSSWFEDVRALGFLRPPWALAFDGLHAAGRG